MLRQIRIRNLAIIEDVTIDFAPGFNVITGETGAGKSIIIDALNLVLGGRGTAEVIRAGCDKALISAYFELDGEPPSLLAEIGLEGERELMLVREIAAGGRSTARINGVAVPLSFLREVGQELVDIQGQHEQQSLFRRHLHRELLDLFGGEELLALRDETTRLYRTWQEKEKALAELKAGEAERERLRDLYAFQLEEIERINPRPGEEEELEAERRRLAAAERLALLCQQAYSDLYSGQPPLPAAVDLVHRAIAAMEEMATADEQVKPTLEEVREAACVLEEAARFLARYGDSIENDPQKLAAVEDRLEDLRRLQKKYGPTLADVLAYRDRIKEELAGAENAVLAGEELEKEITRLRAEYEEKAAALSLAREKAARRLEETVTTELKALAMPHVRFAVALTPSEPGPLGKEEAEFLLSPNPGEPLRPLQRIASGGELARVLLAIKTVLASLDRTPTLIFDEVDAGLGGQALSAVARRLSLLAGNRQVICITHSPQVAAVGDRHLLISKEVRDGRTATRVKVLKEEERVEELARMLAGDRVTATTLLHARDMLAKK